MMLFALMMLATQPSSSAPSFDDLAKKVLVARRSIRSIQLDVEMAESKRNGKRTIRWQLWMDGNKLRGDRTASSQPFPNERVVHCIGCDGDGLVLEYVDKPSLLATLKPLAAVDRPKLFAAADPRHFGHVLNTLTESDKPGFEGTFGVPRDGSAKVSAVVRDVGDCWLMEWTGGPASRPVRYSAIVSPDRGYSLLEYTARIDAEQTVAILSVMCSHKEVNGVWFPSEIHFKQEVNGTIDIEEHAILKVISINQPIDPSVFTSAGVKMRDGTLLQKPGRAAAVRVKDGKLAPLALESFADMAPPTPVADPGERRWNPWLLGVCAVLALAAAFLVVTKLRARRASS